MRPLGTIEAVCSGSMHTAAKGLPPYRVRCRRADVGICPYGCRGIFAVGSHAHMRPLGTIEAVCSGSMHTAAKGLPPYRVRRRRADVGIGPYGREMIYSVQKG